MDTLKPFWFFLWRTALLSPVLGALAGATYGVSILVGGAVFSDGSGEFSLAAAAAYTLGMGLFFDAPGMVAGLVLGLLDGLLLFVVTRAFYHPRPVDVRGYRKAAAWACAAMSVLVLMVDCVLHSFPDPDGFILSRIFREYGLYEASVGNLTVLAVIPMLLLVSVTWFSGKAVASRYAREFEAVEDDTRGTTDASGHPVTD